MAAAAVLGCAGLDAIAAPESASAATTCVATYSVTGQWGTGFGVSITITNDGSAITSWALRYSYPGDQQLTKGWNGNWSQSGETLTVTNANWNGSLPAGASTQIGANFSDSGSNAPPAALACTANSGAAGGSGSFTQADIDSAVSAPPIAFAPPTSARLRGADLGRPRPRDQSDQHQCGRTRRWPRGALPATWPVRFPWAMPRCASWSR